jgi:hypothetical protein
MLLELNVCVPRFQNGLFNYVVRYLRLVNLPDEVARMVPTAVFSVLNIIIRNMARHLTTFMHNEGELIYVVRGGVRQCSCTCTKQRHHYSMCMTYFIAFGKCVFSSGRPCERGRILTSVRLY